MHRAPCSDVLFVLTAVSVMWDLEGGTNCTALYRAVSQLGALNTEQSVYFMYHPV